MQYTPLAIATVATEAAQRYFDTSQPLSRELVARVWADLSREVVCNPVTGFVEKTQDAHSWSLVILDVMEDFADWLTQHALLGSVLDRVGFGILNSCLDFVSLERQ